MRTSLAIVAVALAMSLLGWRTARAGDVTTVTGTVTDYNGAAIEGASIVFAGVDGESTTSTNRSGLYSVSLKPGVYEVRVRRAAFCDGRQPQFLLRSSSKAQFNFELIEANVAIIDQIQTDLGRPLPSSDTKPEDQCYKEDELPPSGAHGLRPLVLYGSREKQHDLTIYRGLRNHDRQYPAEYLYDRIVLKADRLVYSRGDDSIQCSGNVVWQKGGTTERGSTGRITFQSGEPKFQISP